MVDNTKLTLSLYKCTVKNMTTFFCSSLVLSIYLSAWSLLLGKHGIHLQVMKKDLLVSLKQDQKQCGMLGRSQQVQ